MTTLFRNQKSKTKNRKSINPVGWCLLAARRMIPNDKPDTSCCCHKMRATCLQVNKKLPKYTPFSWKNGY